MFDLSQCWLCCISFPFLIVCPTSGVDERHPSPDERHQGASISNAKIEGLREDLGMTDDQYNWCLTAFFFPYSAFEVPSNLLLKRFRPSRWLPFIMVCWGVVVTLTGLVQNYPGLLIARVFLGVTEAGLFPGVTVSCLEARTL
ncbi:hypothetical protein JDV02_002295 [Purpureocillium takamizusanense]|uniref:Major facilitator superfamily (MFS) profile domain-containing protein n=1 Tax=Purpureocillium takamizusanense TaxID=2060973 RepID=A0A9Q8QB46_9HYPO|nr:uncharacterized protein JDV02_002295 [Purpureocillium takamizusanense]UNI15794.1 hypothetical protein JDV02_002295 [Purpureocillium takamizusanense]